MEIKTSKVVLIRCEGYDYSNVLQAVEKGLSLLGGASVFAKKNENIVLKPNMLAGDLPEKCTTTHPSVLKAIGNVFLKTGALISYGDSPGFGSSESVAKKTGIFEAAKEIGISIADFNEGREILFDQAMQNKKFIIANAVLDCDGLISLPKLKAHAFAKMTGAIKNQFGCIPGIRKAEYHVKIPKARDFAKMLVDLNSFIKPRLYIMDGIIAMEGNGPRGGTLKPLNILLFSTDPVALDAIVCRIMNLKPELVPTIQYGKEAGLGTYEEGEIDILGDQLESFIDMKFNINRDPIIEKESSGARTWLRNRLVPKPYIQENKCIKCGVCVNVCPVSPKALDWHDGLKTHPPTYRYDRCIRCYCCQELCPESAINVRTSLFRRLLQKLM